MSLTSDPISAPQAKAASPVTTPPSTLARISEYLITYGLGGIPRPLGTALRKRLYKFAFAQFDSSVYVQADVEFLGTHGIRIGRGSRILKHVRLNANTPGSSINLGKNVLLERGVDINVAGGSRNCNISIGDRAYVGQYTCFSGPGSISVGKDCLIASQCGIVASSHNFPDPDQKIAAQGLTTEGICIEDDCWLGLGVKVLDGVTIGRGSVIGAGAVVNRDIPPYSVAVGVPAKVISQRR